MKSVQTSIFSAFYGNFLQKMLNSFCVSSFFLRKKAFLCGSTLCLHWGLSALFLVGLSALFSIFSNQSDSWNSWQIPILIVWHDTTGSNPLWRECDILAEWVGTLARPAHPDHLSSLAPRLSECPGYHHTSCSCRCISCCGIRIDDSLFTHRSHQGYAAAGVGCSTNPGCTHPPLPPTNPSWLWFSSAPPPLYWS